MILFAIVVYLCGLLPADTEPRKCPDLQWAVEAAKKPIYNNQILSKSVTYAIQWPGNPILTRAEKEQMESEVGQALQSALTEWGSSLLLIRRSLDQHLSAYLENSLLCSGNSCQYNAPPAVRVSCIENASLVFQLYASGGKNFPDAGDGAVARAQVRGRTILLNLRSYHLIYDQHLFAIMNADSSVNLTAVIAHELGHSFGLVHAQNGENSIMLPNLSGMIQARVPSARDGAQFARILGEFIIGSKAGEFEAIRCEGLKVRKQ